MEYVKEYWGITEYYKNGVLHRDGDLPAVISARGDLENVGIWKNGRRHLRKTARAEDCTASAETEDCTWGFGKTEDGIAITDRPL